MVAELKDRSKTISYRPAEPDRKGFVVPQIKADHSHHDKDRAHHKMHGIAAQEAHGAPACCKRATGLSLIGTLTIIPSTPSAIEAIHALS